MIELNETNANEFLMQRRWIDEPARIEPLSGGVSGLVLRVVTADSQFVVKQSRPQLRTREDWFSDLDRIFREVEVMQVLEPLMPAGIVPKVLHVDRDHYAYAMSHAPMPHRVWKEMLLAGEVDPALAESVGAVLGQMHQVSIDHRDHFEQFSEVRLFEQLRITPFYRRVQPRRPEVADRIGDLIERMVTLKVGLCHGDYTPKNMLVHDAGLTLVDYETAYFGDPAMDIGLCSCHLLLKALRRPDDIERMLGVFRGFFTGYRQIISVDLAPGIQHLGTCLLARVDGTSPADYLRDEALRDRVRQLGISILRDRVGSPEEVIEMVTKS